MFSLNISHLQYALQKSKELKHLRWFENDIFPCINKTFLESEFQRVSTDLSISNENDINEILYPMIIDNIRERLSHSYIVNVRYPILSKKRFTFKTFLTINNDTRNFEKNYGIWLVKIKQKLRSDEYLWFAEAMVSDAYYNDFLIYLSPNDIK